MLEYKSSHANDEFVHLTNEEIDYCARIGMKMRQHSKKTGHRNHQGYNPDDAKAMKVQALGAVCEGAACRALGRAIELGQQTYGVPDLRGGVQVRLIGNDNYGLRVYPKDNDKWKVFGVIIPRGRERLAYRLPGWFYAGEAKLEKSWQMAPCGRPPMFAIPQECLRPNSELRAILSQEGIPSHDQFLWCPQRESNP